LRVKIETIFHSFVKIRIYQPGCIDPGAGIILRSCDNGVTETAEKYLNPDRIPAAGQEIDRLVQED